MNESDAEFRPRHLSRKLKVLQIIAGVLCLLFWGIWLPDMGPSQIYPKLLVTWVYVFWLFRTLQSHRVSSRTILIRFVTGAAALYLAYWILYMGILSTAGLVGIFGK